MRTIYSTDRKFTDAEILHGVYRITLPTGETVTVGRQVYLAIMRRHPDATVYRIGVKVSRYTSQSYTDTMDVEWANYCHLSDAYIATTDRCDYWKTAKYASKAQRENCISDNLTIGR